MTEAFKSIRARTTAVFAIAVALIIMLGIGGLVHYARRVAERNASAVVNAGRAKIVQELKDDGDNDAKNLAHLIDDEIGDLRPDNLSLFLTDKAGRVLYPVSHSQPTVNLGDVHRWRTSRIRVGDQFLVVALPWSETEESLASLARTLSIFGGFVVVIATIGAWAVVGRTLSPIGRLSHQADSASVDGLRVSLKPPSQDAEIVGLVGTLNGLLDRLAEAATAKGRFYSAASHELRTPLQALSGHLELALQKDRTPEEYKATIEEALRQTARLVKLTRSLMFLYQLDSGARPEAESVDLTAVCTSVLHELRPIARDRGLRVTESPLEKVTVTAPVAHLEVLIRNLLENALRYAENDGEVRVHVGKKPGVAAISVFNSCKLPADWMASKLFEPFFRMDASRNSETGGTGLGLTICRAIAEVNGWALTLGREGDGVMATLTIPVASDGTGS